MLDRLKIKIVIPRSLLFFLCDLHPTILADFCEPISNAVVVVVVGVVVVVDYN